MKLKYKTNFSGYLPILRGLLLLLKNHTLNFTQLGIYICLVSQVDFDDKHDNYKILIRDDAELAKEWGVDASTIYRHRRSLIKKGLFIERDGLTVLPNFHIFQLEWVKIFAKLPYSTLQTLFTELQEDIEKEQFFIAEVQKKQDQKDTQSFNVSSKGELSSSTKDNSYVNEYEDIDNILSEVDNENR